MTSPLTLWVRFACGEEYSMACRLGRAVSEDQHNCQSWLVLGQRFRLTQPTRSASPQVARHLVAGLDLAQRRHVHLAARHST